MGKLVRLGLAHMDMVTDRKGLILKNNWRCNFVGCDGIVAVYESKKTNPGKYFIKFFATGPHVGDVTSTYGDIEVDKDYLFILKSQNTRYVFTLKEKLPVFEAGENESDISIRFAVRCGMLWEGNEQRNQNQEPLDERIMRIKMRRRGKVE